MEMHFTYTAYQGLLERLKKKGYNFIGYGVDEEPGKRVVILRHDIDTDISKAVRLAELEQKCGVHSTYFVLVTSDFYNVFSGKSAAGLHRILDLGHEIGLHFDEMRYPEIAGKGSICCDRIQVEAKVLSAAIGRPVDKVSYHRPSKEILDAELEIPGMINSYSPVYFKQYKYLSDSRRRWREPVLDILESETFDKLHILTHAFWYQEKAEKITDTVKRFIEFGKLNRYVTMRENITDLDSIIKEEDI